MRKQGISEFRELEPSNLVQDLIIKVEDDLPRFTESEEFLEILKTKKNENQHSHAFCVFMNNHNQDFIFMTETQQAGSRSVDIGVYKGHVLFFTIEAKILPTPKNATRKEYEYVYGNGGGIQRFKDCNHGLDHEGNLISENGLIAFVKEESYETWLERINQWISDAGWDSSEKLKKINFNSIARLKSRHLRKESNSNVMLFHFWTTV